MKKRPIGIEEQIMNGRCLSCLAENINTNLSETLSTTYQSLLPDEVRRRHILLCFLCSFIFLQSGHKSSHGSSKWILCNM